MIGDKIKEVLKRRGLNNREGAEKCGFTFATFYSYVSGTRTPPVPALRKIATGLNVPIEDLLQEPEPTYPHVEMIMKDPTARASFEKMMVKWSQLPEEAKKSVDDYIAFVLEQGKEKK